MFVPSPPLLWAILCLFGVLAAGTVIRILWLRGQPESKTLSHFKSVRSWWALASVLTVASMLGHTGVLALLAIAGLLSLRELLQLIGWKRLGKATVCVVFFFPALYYTLLLCGYQEQIRAPTPIAIVLVLGAFRAWLGLVEDFIRITAAMIWGELLFVYCLSHAYLLLDLPGLPEPWAGNLGWFLYLVLLTESNDIAQAIIGRQFGRTKIVPITSPNKSLEGLLGGILITTLLAIAISPWLTSFMQNSWKTGVLLAAVSGILIAMFGFLGDINKSGMKRDIGVKDSGTLIPGQGGMMDRIDSLTFSAPIFYYFVRITFQMD